jgi:DNA-binding transcriptional MocR family regulator
LIEDLNIRVLEVPVDSRRGIDPDRIQKLFDGHDVLAALFNPYFHNTLGYVISGGNETR